MWTEADRVDCYGIQVINPYEVNPGDWGYRVIEVNFSFNGRNGFTSDAGHDRAGDRERASAAEREPGHDQYAQRAGDPDPLGGLGADAPPAHLDRPHYRSLQRRLGTDPPRGRITTPRATST